MTISTFRLISTYEIMLTTKTTTRPVRIEIFKIENNDSIYRARIWVQNTYNLYPSSINTDCNGNDLHNTHSSDQIDMEITSLIAEAPDLITGKYFTNENACLTYVKSRIKYYQKIIDPPH